MRIALHMLSAIWLTWRMARRGDDFEQRSRVRRAWYDRALWIAGVRVRVEGELPPRPSLVVANHVSWLDIPLIGSTVDPCFLSKAEIARWPIIGWLARQHDTRFIERGAHQASAHVEAMRQGLDDGRHFVVFPEGTTSRGEFVRRFHPRLFAAVTGSGHPVQPVALDYERAPSGQVPASYADDDRLVVSVWKLLCRRETPVTLHFLAPMETADQERRDLAEGARNAIVGTLGLPVDPPSGRQTRRAS
ncbi:MULTISPECIES: 1-acyl-sn-glycerol-3-phosphate acyltransferase [unclassified Thioalkalivibrio]|uniref:lysophospholipid acyltransferase family protein n=1 Tax=unclassified Thioalkalivibrio TaxID=2621013 RepID=UPI000381608A|nr:MULTISPECIES: lysophospholipid acyltransferase family protein [unclassified Thioalkalivibrio]